MSEQLGPYVLEQRIGSGGMADVFLARGPKGTCVIKRPYPHLCANPDFVRMFLDEAALLAQLNHPGIAQIYDLGHIDGVYYLAMEYVPGFDLMTMSLEHERQGELIAVDLCCRIIADAAAALHYAHEAVGANGQPLNLVHRDVTPHNILLSTAGEVKLIDFGVAKAATATHRTQAGLVKGKYAYMAPEQITAQAIDRRVDIYALGLCLYELLTNVRAIAGVAEPEQIENARQSRITPIERLRPNIPEPVRRIVASCLHPDPAGRYQTAKEVHDQLELYLSLERRTVGRDDLLRLFRVVAAEVSHFTRPPSEAMARPTEREQAAVGAVVVADNVDPQNAEALGGAPTAPSMKMVGFPQGVNAPPAPHLAPVTSLEVEPIKAPPPSGPTRILEKSGPVPAAVKPRSAWPMFVVGLIVAIAAGLWWVTREAPPVGADGSAVTPGPAVVLTFDAGAPEEAPVVDAGETAVAANAAPDAGSEAPDESDAGASAAAAPILEVAVVNVSSSPETVVFVDAKKWGPTPQELHLEAGRHQLLLTNGPLNIRYAQTLTVKAGEQREVKVALQQGSVHFSITPFGRVTLAGKELLNGLSSATQAFYEGTYVFEVSNAELKKSQKVTTTVKPGETSEVSVNLMQ